MVLIDVEEEFDWEQPFDRANTAAATIPDLERGLEVINEAGVVPIGVMSYPVVQHERSAEHLRRYVAAGTMEPGAHLHPWVNPPHDEDVTGHNSFPGNLPASLEGAKIAELAKAIEAAVGERPRVYQAGRYGAGPNTFGLLEDQGFLVDMSVSPGYDYRSEGGPDFTASINEPSWIGSSLLELPVTGAMVGFLGGAASGAFRLANKPALSFTRLTSVLARSGAAERLRLSPEGHGLDDMQRLTRALVARGLRHFTCSFHSPSLVPGHTSYVRNPAQRDEFLERLRRYIAWFREELGGEGTTPLRVHADLLQRFPPTPRSHP